MGLWRGIGLSLDGSTVGWVDRWSRPLRYIPRRVSLEESIFEQVYRWVGLSLDKSSRVSLGESIADVGHYYYAYVDRAVAGWSYGSIESIVGRSVDG